MTTRNRIIPSPVNLEDDIRGLWGPISLCRVQTISPQLCDSSETFRYVLMFCVCIYIYTHTHSVILAL